MPELDQLTQDIDQLVKDTVEEINQTLDSKHVVGEAMTFGDTTIIPLVAMGFGFGAGGGGGEGHGTGGEGMPEGQGQGGGAGGGGGVKPVAVIIVNPDGVTVTAVPGEPSGLEKLGAAIGTAMARRGGNGKD
ncbi:MAG: spore germination protein GerW family protein [Chloroflexi bacterium]|nr:spore germination protein GerW family protein [Chloroflexota bacterium]